MRKASEAEIALRQKMQALITYFNTPEGFSAFGWHGDEQGWPPERTAIEGLRECVRLRKELAEERERCAKIAEGPIYKERYRGDDENNWSIDGSSPYGNGRLDAALFIRQS